MAAFLGIDTSNYTTSASLYLSDRGIVQKKRLLPVRHGECGLRQSDAVFHHTKQLPEIISELMSEYRGQIDAIGVSDRPRDAEGSYMPCFLVGAGTASSLSSVLNVPLYTFSHQSGHIAAAVYSAGCPELLRQPFLAFHVSGGTTEAVLVTPDAEKIFKTEIVAKTLDLNAGQLIDRVGVMMGLSFPCGKELEALAARCEIYPKTKATLKGADCCLSGIENVCRKAFETGASKEETALLCLSYVEATLSGMCQKLLSQFGDLPIVFAGGVMSDRIIRERLQKRFSAFFAEPAFSADNAAGIAYLCSQKHLQGKQLL